MSFDVAGEAYDRLVGRYSRLLAPRFLDFAGVREGPVLDVGAGPGALAAELAGRLGPARVAAVEPSPPFAAACRARVPGIDVRVAGAESLPFAGGAFAAALSQLVFSFLPDPDRAMAELLRVVRPGGTIAACSWAFDGFPIAQVFWEAATRLDRGAPDDARLPFRRPGELDALFRRAGLSDLASGEIEVEAGYADFDDLWDSYLGGAGPMGGYVVKQPEERRRKLREGVRSALGNPAGPFTLRSRALAVRGTVPASVPEARP